MKKLLSLVLATAMVASLGITAFAGKKATSGQQDTKVKYTVGAGGFMWTVPDTVDFNNGILDEDTGILSQSGEVAVLPQGSDRVMRVPENSILTIKAHSNNGFKLNSYVGREYESEVAAFINYKFLDRNGAELPNDKEIIKYKKTAAQPSGQTEPVGFSALVDDINELEVVGTYVDKITFDLTYFDAEDEELFKNGVDHSWAADGDATKPGTKKRENSDPKRQG